MIGILGGTFDPVHFGHLRPALEVQQALGLDEIRLMPCHVPPHRPQPQATPRQRVAMLRAGQLEVQLAQARRLRGISRGSECRMARLRS